MFLLFLESLITYANLNQDTHLLIYTSTEFMNIIKQKIDFDFTSFIVFEINDTYNTIDLACKSRLDLFDLNSIQNYSKILYLDTDILIKNDINCLFELVTDDILYVLGEGSIDNTKDYYGYSLFEQEIHNYPDKTAFTSGIMLFNNCENIKTLFQNIKLSIINKPKFFVCYDQPYIVYNAFKYNLYNNKILQEYRLYS
jgi:lipopolysaccharide biosynthesis glycosyltransferase